MRNLPEGTVTFVFTDVDGSTRMLQELGAEDYADALASHRRTLRDVFGRRGGVEVDTQGDAFFYAFPTAASALHAAGAAQGALETTPVTIRIGVHTGVALITDEGYVGEDVHRAARIAASGHGGQVLVSSSTAPLAGEHPLRDLGEHRLKDLTAPERIYQLGPRDFPPLRTLFQTNLPVPATPFLGRQTELADVRRLLERAGVRLLTLTGPGGTGKTRLALQAAGAMADEYPNGVYWVALAPLQDPARVMSTAAQALGAPGDLAEHIGDSRMLVLLDNFEHLLEAAPALGDLLAACPRLDVLVTSRERLHLAAEQEYDVPPFSEADGLAFFKARARAAQPGFEADGTVAEICQRLDQLPLALDLAAARVKAFTADDLLARLEQRLPLLTGGASDLPERQQTLRATIGWSHELLDDTERRLFRQLGVFRGGCTLEAAEQVADAELDAVQGLVDKSLLRRSGERYWMLGSIREYAVERLAEACEDSRVRTRHAGYFLALARRAGLSLEPLGKQDFALFAGELDNVRAALTWWTEQDPVRALELATRLEMLWTVEDPAEGMSWFEQLLDKATGVPLELRARALLAYASAAHPAGDDALPERLYQESLAAFRAAGDQTGVGILLFRLGNNAYYRGENERARELAEQSLALHESLGNVAGKAQAVALLGELEWAAGNRESGADLIGQSADLAGEADFTWWRARMLRKLVDCLLALERPKEAEAAARESLELMWNIGDRQMVVFTLARLARLAGETGRLEDAGTLWGAIEGEELRSPLGAWAKERERLAAPVFRHDGPELRAGIERGRLLSLAEAVDAALAPPPPALTAR
jgi:predicted ATPase/class 3 adenylate cyclase